VQIAILARRRNLPRDTIVFDRPAFLRQFAVAAPALFAPVVLIAGMMAGTFGATEAAGVTVAYALLVGVFIYRKLTVSNVIASARETVRSCASILFIVGASEVFAWVLTVDQVPAHASAALLALSADPWMLLLIANLILLVVGTVLEPLPAILILAPILTPGLVAAGVDPVHLGVVVVLNLMIGLLTPPVGMSLYMVSNVGRIPLEKVMVGAWPFIVSLTIALLIVTFVPAFSTWLPNMFIK
jgi:tripartite ATP-independent transporter DctM subunit